MIEIKRKKRSATEAHTERAQIQTDGVEAQEKGTQTFSTKSTIKRDAIPFIGADNKRDYPVMYRVAFDYHKSHNPPYVDIDYWRNHPEGGELPDAEIQYWERAAEDLTAAAEQGGNDPFLIELLNVIYKELNIQQEAIRKRETA